MKQLLSFLAACLLLAGCGVDKEAEAQALRNEINELKSEACSTWTSGIVASTNGEFDDSIIMSESAAQKFAELAAKDPTYDYASKSAYRLTAFNGSNPSNIATNLKALLVVAVTDIKRACLG
jgi:hypothetical protein